MRPNGAADYGRSEDGDSLTLTINGEQRTIRDLAMSAPLEAVLASLKVRREMVAVALNDVIVPRAHWDKTFVFAEDRIEIVHFVGGGRLSR